MDNDALYKCFICCGDIKDCYVCFATRSFIVCRLFSTE